MIDPSVLEKVHHLRHLVDNLPVHDEERLNEAMRPVIDAACDVQCQLYRIWLERRPLVGWPQVKKAAATTEELADLLS